jgi:hypothetical protein
MKIEKIKAGTPFTMTTIIPRAYMHNAFVNSGLHWKLARMPVESSSHLTEYVLFIETLPKIPLSVPD